MTPQEIVRLLRSAPAGKADEELSSPLEDKWERPPIFITPGIPGSLSELPARCLGDEEIVAGFTPIREAPDEIAPPLPMDSDCCFEVPVDILERLPRRPAEVSPLVPDISAGLGHRQEKYEMKQLELFAIEQLELRVYNGDLCEFRPPCWTRLDSRACTIRLKELFRQHSLDTHLGTSDYRELYHALCTNPALQGGEYPEPPLHCLNLRDATYDIGRDAFYPHNPGDGFFHALELTSDELISPGDGSVFEAFISSVSGGAPDVRQQVLELIALACTGYQVKSFFVLVGPSGTGKSQFGRFLVELLGHENATAIGGVHELGSRFALAGMEDKQLAVCMDLPDTPLPAAAIGTLKTAVGDDVKRVEAKYQNPKTIRRGPLWLFASNHPLRLPNISQEEAFLKRMILIPFLHAVPPDRQIPQLYKKLLDETPYILAQSIQAYRQLMGRSFILTRSDIPPEYYPGEGREEVAAVKAFVEQCCVADADCEITTEELFRTFSLISAPGAPINKVAFSRTIARLFAAWDGVSEVKRAAGTNQRGYRGIRLFEAG